MSSLPIVQSALLADAALTALVGADGVFVDAAPEKRPFPYVILRQVANRPFYGLDDSVNARRESFEVESWGKTRTQTTGVHEAAELALRAAGLPPEEADPDGLDPEVWAKAAVWLVDVWT